MAKTKARAAVKQSKVDTVMELARAKRAHLRRAVATQRDIERLARQIDRGVVAHATAALLITAGNIGREQGHVLLERETWERAGGDIERAARRVLRLTQLVNAGPPICDACECERLRTSSKKRSSGSRARSCSSRKPRTASCDAGMGHRRARARTARRTLSSSG
jgi:hypothetical protein